ncbi:hypothetical protein BABINDRAFT_160785 [Babjeviella inositovora NRRL Y-12698]|uniref:Very-long-chain (3R)-3-hydroxyacyl-CoA dehydratase n=1 Tax=Babjeviella inositovora NRRL Y-12698 TaxID=984486 RepID=A0A1E3QU35_9ASCO|nr:uncharacterized protein BABINDRAFT_160785 [Babjeviella inositovora NRRL Y-12698]ODQ80512.1 hypothetical protein BABINDRAFT_160785 [Babjeviella inositovora NRRL Y-12698]
MTDPKKPASVQIRRTKARAHLQIFNIVEILLWVSVLFRTLLLLPLVGRKFLPGGIADFFIYVTTFTAAIQTINTILGLSNSRNRLLCIFVQAHKCWFVWDVLHVKIVKHGLFSLLIVLWSVSNICRFAFYTYKLSRGSVHNSWLKTLYANEFLLTLPLGMVAEWGLIFMKLRYVDGTLRLFMQLVLVLYVPSFYILFDHYLKKKTLLGEKQHHA